MRDSIEADRGTLGFMQDIGGVPADLNYATSLFFITFVIFQPISAAVGRWVGPKHWIPFMMVGSLPSSQG